ncbi:MAG: triose-phosphate isomerase [Chloroflexi bacterium]|jgi:triosephosphate isomerase|nr:MAG: triose-phosphate isomerase [SAR202 cluster bacterium MP-SAtl-SRR3965592-G1]PKB83931.1 MAG: triose-phosphate isomerase [SAR202 cluster bacterium MP-SInd-SRR3963457-G1]RUA29607.1 MAG: triose-phosphate isomerase [Chloroflexota bacterium]
MPDLVVAGNWKMNTTVAEAVALAAAVRDGAASASGVELVLCPPFVSLAAVSDAVKGSAVKVGAQNMHFEDSGAFTGEVSPGMLQDLCDYVIVGHSERRQMFAETDETVNNKVKAAQAAGLKPIMCVGETLEEREAGKASDIISGQVRAGLEGITDTSGLIVAYEPIWAIGTGRSATPETAAEIMGGAILETLRSLFPASADNISLLYGGSMNAGNAGDYAAQSCIHGGLVGGAALQAESFLQVAAAIAAAKD